MQRDLCKILWSRVMHSKDLDRDVEWIYGLEVILDLPNDSSGSCG